MQVWPFESSVMKKLVWVVLGVGILIWSGLAWFVHSLVGWGGAVASGNADILTPVPEAVEWLSWFAIFGTNIGEWIIISVWALGVILALIIGFASSYFLPQLKGLAEKLKSPV